MHGPILRNVFEALELGCTVILGPYKYNCYLTVDYTWGICQDRRYPTRCESSKMCAPMTGGGMSNKP